MLSTPLMTKKPQTPRKIAMPISPCQTSQATAGPQISGGIMMKLKPKVSSPSTSAPGTPAMTKPI